MTSALELKVIFAAVDRFVRPVNNITNSASAAAKALRESQKDAQKLNKVLQNIDGYNRVTDDAAKARKEFEKNSKRISDLKEKFDKLGVPTEKMTERMGQLIRKSGELTDRISRLKNHEVDLRVALEQSHVDTKNLAEARKQLATATGAAETNSRRMSAQLDAENQKMRRLREAQADLAKAREKASKLTGLGTKMMAGGAAINAAAAVPVLAYAQAEDAATQLKIAMMQRGGHVSSQFAEIDALAMKLGNRLPGTTADFQDMMTMLIRQGMPASTILGGLGEATAYLAAQLKMAPRDAAEFASKLQDATRATDKEMMGLMDTIQKTFYLGVDQNNMLQGFAKLSPALSVIKKEGAEAARELAPLLVMTDQAGMQGEASGNAFRKIFQMSLDAKKLAKGNAELAGTGIKLNFSDGKGEFGGLAKMYAQLEKLRSVSTQQRLAALKKIFGDDAETLQALTIMIEKGAAGYADVQAKLSAQADIQERVNAQLATLKSLWDAASGTFTNALVAFGEAIAPELHAAAEMLGKVAERAQEWAKNNPALAGGLMSVVKWVGMAALGLGALTAAAGAILVPMAMLKFSMTTLGIGTNVSRLSKIGDAIKGLGAFAARSKPGITLFSTALGNAWRGAGPSIPVWHRIKSAWAALPALAGRSVDAARRMGGGAITGVINRYDSARQSVAGYSAALIDSIKKGKVAASTKITSAIGYVKTNGIGGTAMNALSALKHGASSGIRAAWANISNVIMGAGRALLFVGRAALMNPIGLAITALVVGGAMVFKYWEPIKAFFSGFWQGLKEGMAPLSGMFDRAFGALKPILEPLKPVWDWVISAVKTTFDWVGKLFAPFESTSESMKKATENGKGLGMWLGGFVVTVAELAGKFFGFGANIIGGLINGILSGWGALKALIGKLAGMLPDVVANKLGIRSPSRVFAELGMHTMAGLEQGIDENGNGPLSAIKRVSAAVAAGGALTLGAPAMASHGGNSAAGNQAIQAGNTYQITINAPAGTDSTDLAMLVSREIARIEASKAAQYRSRLRDQE